MLDIRGLSKVFRSRAAESSVVALDDVSLRVQAGEFFALLGPSGCGKTTLLQSIAGLETPDRGLIKIGGQSAFDAGAGHQTPANRRGVGMVFQSYAIWPHMSVYDNVAFPLVYGRDYGQGDVRPRVMEALARVKLERYAERPAPHLSGGQQQRVALARAIINQPKLLLLDEPLSNLDAKLRQAMRGELRALVQSLGLTAVFVTHDQTEALAMADRIALMRDGKIVQIGTPSDIYFNPESIFAADFIGDSNLLKAKVSTDGTKPSLETGMGRIVCKVPPEFPPGADVVLVLRPHALSITVGDAPGPNHFIAAVRRRTFLGDAIELEIEAGSQLLRLRLSSYDGRATGPEIAIAIIPERCIVTGPGAPTP